MLSTLLISLSYLNFDAISLSSPSSSFSFFLFFKCFYVILAIEEAGQAHLRHMFRNQPKLTTGVIQAVELIICEI